MVQAMLCRYMREYLPPLRSRRRYYKENIERVEKCVEAIYTLVLKMNGTISGEHGIGMAKFLSMELAAESIRLQQDIKKLFDPNLILNPSKIFPDESLFI